MGGYVILSFVILMVIFGHILKMPFVGLGLFVAGWVYFSYRLLKGPY